MQASYPLAFEREMGCTEADLRALLPEACGGRPVEWRHDGVGIVLDRGIVSIEWSALEPRRIAQVVLPRLRVRFAARGVDPAAWQRFMRYFDLYTQRGGG